MAAVSRSAITVVTTWLLSTSLWVSAGLALALVASAHVLDISLDSTTLGLAFSSSLLVYNLDHLRDSGRELAGGRRGRSPLLRGIVIAAALGTAIALVRSSPAVRLVFAIYGGLGVVYGASLAGGFRLKDVPGLKSWIVTVAAVIAAVGLPLADSGRRFDLDAVQIALTAFATVAVNTHLCDVIDLHADRAQATPTLPVLVGVATTRRLLRAILVTSALVLMVGWAASWFSFHPEILLLLALNTALIYAVTAETLPVRGYLLIDGVLFLLPLAAHLHAL